RGLPRCPAGGGRRLPARLRRGRGRNGCPAPGRGGRVVLPVSCTDPRPTDGGGPTPTHLFLVARWSGPRWLGRCTVGPAVRRGGTNRPTGLRLPAGHARP